MILDGDFEEWEAYASAGRYGRPEPARVVFRCRSDPLRRPRVTEIEGDRAKAEGLVQTLSDGELVELFGASEEVA